METRHTALRQLGDGLLCACDACTVRRPPDGSTDPRRHWRQRRLADASLTPDTPPINTTIDVTAVL